MSSWIISSGWCVDKNGSPNGKGPNEDGLQQEECFDKCQTNTNFKACTYYPARMRCNTYTGDIVGGNGHGAYKCFHSSGKKYILISFF